MRLRQGKMDQDTVYSEDPVGMARHWVAAGAKRLHVVDLDGAAQGRPMNMRVIRDIVQSVPGTVIQVGGGIRNEDTIQAYLESGVSFLIIGTKAVASPHFVADACLEFPNHIIVGLDMREGKPAIEGWSKLSHLDPLSLAQRFEEDGVVAVVYTDISRDGMLDGINIEATLALARQLTIPVIASGGIRDIDDIRALCAVEHEGIKAAIAGRSLYEGTLDFTEAQKLAQPKAENSWG